MRKCQELGFFLFLFFLIYIKKNLKIFVDIHSYKLLVKKNVTVKGRNKSLYSSVIKNVIFYCGYVLSFHPKQGNKPTETQGVAE